MSEAINAGSVTLEQIAHAAGIPVLQVVAGIEELVHYGYLAPVGDGTYQLTIPEGRR